MLLRMTAIITIKMTRCCGRRCLRVMRQVTGAAFNSAASRFEVNPEEVAHERFLEVAVDFWMVDYPQQLIDRQNRLTHRLYETVLALQAFNERSLIKGTANRNTGDDGDISELRLFSYFIYIMYRDVARKHWGLDFGGSVDLGSILCIFRLLSVGFEPGNPLNTPMTMNFCYSVL